MAWQRQWNRHPAVRTGEQLSLGERAADKMRNGMGSWPFVFTFFGFMITWAVVNSVVHFGGSSGFDPYPYILLNLFLSMLAGVQAAALLIAAKRADSIASEIAVHTEKNTDDIKTLLQQNTDLTRAVESLTRQVHEQVCKSASLSTHSSTASQGSAAGLALEDAQLMAENEYLGLEAGLGAAADEEEIEEQAEQAVEQGQEHDLASSQAWLLAQISCRSEFLRSTLIPTDRLVLAALGRRLPPRPLAVHPGHRPALAPGTGPPPLVCFRTPTPSRSPADPR